MPRPMFDSQYIFGIHEEGGERYMIEAGKPGWILFTEGVGSDPSNQAGRDYSPFSNQGLGVMARLNNGYYPQGTIPTSDRYEDFAQRCANFVANSPGCKIWIIGNEMNHEIERPRRSVRHTAAPIPPAALPEGEAETAPADEHMARWQAFWTRFLHLFGHYVESDEPPTPPAPPAGEPLPHPPGAPEPSVIPPEEADPLHHGDPQRFSALAPPEMEEESDEPAGPVRPLAQAIARANEEVITPERYARCYTLCRDAIHALPGHADDQVLIGAVAPWNDQTKYDGNPSGDWVQYMRDILDLLSPDGCDGITLHTYTHQADPNQIYDEAKMGAPFEHRHYYFRAYRDFMGAIPQPMRRLPVYITETDEDAPWENRNIEWVQRAYGEIDYWNQQPGNQQIRSLILYRWPRIDKWYIEGKQGVIDDFKQALQNDYRWREAPANYKAGDVLAMLDLVNIRRTPSYVGQPADDVIATLPVDARVQVLDANWTEADGLIWWRVRVLDQAEQPVEVPAAGAEGWVAQSSPGGAPLVQKVGETTPPEPDDELGVGSLAKTLDFVNLRRSPGYLNKPADDVIASLPPDTQVAIVGGPRQANGLTWWEVRGVDRESNGFDGWMAETDPSGIQLLVKTGEMELPPSLPDNNGKFKTGDSVVTLDYVRFRRSPGYLNKPADDVIADLTPGSQGTVLGGPRRKDDLTWWRLRMPTPAGDRQNGWAAESDPSGIELLGAADGPPPPNGDDGFHRGDLIMAAADVRVRRSPGYVNKPDDDTLGNFLPKTTLNIVGGPVEADGLTWWRVGGISLAFGELVGWVAESAPNGVVLLTRAPKLPGTDIPNPATGKYLAMPFRGDFGIAQLWGERPEVYSQFTYDGVPLKGHNGIDFLTPTGTQLQAVDDGVVAAAVYNDPSGFGNYVLLHHAWGESIYAHMEGIDVQQGQAVRRGQLLGRSDSTGFSGGPHLHFAIRINPYERTDGWGGFSDPLPYLPRPQVHMPDYVLPPEQRRPTPQGAPAPSHAPLPGVFAPGFAPDQPGVRRP